jgi:hypothetical protein
MHSGDPTRGFIAQLFVSPGVIGVHALPIFRADDKINILLSTRLNEPTPAHGVEPKFSLRKGES